MISFECTVSKAGESVFDMKVEVAQPTRVAGTAAQYTCTLTLGDEKPVGIFGGTPIDAVINALNVAKAVVEGKTGNTVDWK